MPIAQLCRQFRSKSKFKNLPVCHSSYKVCGPIYCEMKNRNRTSKRRHQDACIGRSGHSQIAIQNSKFKNLPLFLNTNPDPLRRTPGSPGVICFHDRITFSIRQENRPATRDAPLIRPQSLNPHPSTLNHFVTQVTRFVDLYTVK